MQKASPFYVETNAGRLELTKGAFLTLQKRKNSTFRTVAKTKTKPILKDNNKPTVRRTCPFRPDQVGMVSRAGNQIRFSVTRESDKLRWKMLKSLPLIEMNYDNDQQSQWCEIQGSVNNLAMSLSLAAYDQRMT